MLLTYDKKVNFILWIVLAVLPPCFVLPMYFLTDFGLSNSLLVPSLVYLAIAGLCFVHRAGTFDVFEFQMGRWFSSWGRRPGASQMTANEFSQERKRKRKNHPFPYLPFLSYGTILLILCIIFAYAI